MSQILACLAGLVWYSFTCLRWQCVTTYGRRCSVALRWVPVNNYMHLLTHVTLLTFLKIFLGHSCQTNILGRAAVAPHSSLLDSCMCALQALQNDENILS